MAEPKHSARSVRQARKGCSHLLLVANDSTGRTREQRSVTFVRSTFKSSTLVKVCRLHFSCRLPPAQSSPKVPLLAQNEVRDNPHCRELTGTWLPKTAEAAAATLRQNCSRSTASFCWSAPLCTQRVPKFSRMPWALRSTNMPCSALHGRTL